MQGVGEGGGGGRGACAAHLKGRGGGLWSCGKESGSSQSALGSILFGKRLIFNMFTAASVKNPTLSHLSRRSFSNVLFSSLCPCVSHFRRKHQPLILTTTEPWASNVTLNPPESSKLHAYTSTRPSNQLKPLHSVPVAKLMELMDIIPHALTASTSFLMSGEGDQLLIC